MALDEPEENEKSVQVNGIELLISDYIRPHVEGLKIDYLQEKYRKGFTFNSAGCGGSGCSC